MEYELYHYGVKGMKWGVRRSPKVLDRLAGRVRKRSEREEAYRKKLTNITKRGSKVNESDLKRFKYRNQSLAKRAAPALVSSVASVLVTDMLSGKIGNYGSMSKVELAKKLTGIAAQTAGTVALNDALAKSAAKGYRDDGKRVKNPDKKDRRLLTKEDVVESLIPTAVATATVVGTVAGLKMNAVKAKRMRDEAVFNRWGQNILPEKVDNVIWQSDDLSYAIIDNR